MASLATRTPPRARVIARARLARRTRFPPSVRIAINSVSIFDYMFWNNFVDRFSDLEYADYARGNFHG